MGPGPKEAATVLRSLAGIAVAAGATFGALLAAQPALAQSGRIEKPNITFGVFPITNYGVVYLSIQQSFSRQKV